MTRYIKIDAAVVEAAADEIHEMAVDLKLSHTANGGWPESEAKAKKDHDYLMELYGKLNEATA